MHILPLISESDIKRTSDKDGVTFTKHVYVSCDCGSLDHAARMTVHKEICKNPRKKGAHIVCEDVYFDFNMTEHVNVSEQGRILNTPLKRILSPVKRFFRRLDAAVNLALNKPVYVSADILLTFENAKEFATKIKTSIDEVSHAE